MPLFDVTNRPVRVNPKDAEQYEVLVKLKREVQPNTWTRMIQTVSEAIDSVEPSEKTKLIWTRSASLFGEGSMRPRRHIDHLWENIESIMGQDKLSLMAAGGLLRWQISLRSETWLVYRRDSDQTDPSTGKLITISEYWVNENFVPPTKPKAAKPAASSINDLASRWGARISGNA